MNKQSNKEPENNTYLIDAESSLEMARLLDQDQVMTRGMGGVLAEQDDTRLQSMTHILDIASGPGGWVNETAQQYPHIEVTGIDISKNTINYAKAHARVRKLNNAHFMVMDALKSLDFADNSFDLVNMRTVVGFIPRDQWLPFLKECTRVLRPGGLLRLTEGEYGFSNKPAYEAFMAKLNEAQFRAKRSFSPTGHNAGMVSTLRPLLKSAGLQNIQSKSHVIDISYGMDAYEGGVEDTKFALELVQPLFFGTKVISPEAFTEMRVRVLEEMQEEDFSSVAFLLTAWGEKP